MIPGAEWPAFKWGDAGLPPVILLHGFLGSGTDWSSLAESLAESHRVICPDLPGHGDNVLSEPVAFEAVSAALGAFLDSIGVASCGLVGYSMGGRVALHFVLCHPGRVSRLVLESASPGLEDEHIRESRCLHDDTLAAELAALPDGDSLRDWLRQWYSAPLWESLHRRDGLVDALIKTRTSNNPASLAAGLRSLSVGRQPSLWRELADLSCPTLLLCGERDHKYEEITEKMLEVNPDLASMVFADCGHNVHLEAPAAYTTVLKRFLAG